MKKNPLISIIVPFYNTNLEFIHSLLSILANKNSKIECIFIDDGSEEKNSNFVKENCKINNFKYFKYGKNRGVSYARNFGIKKANGKYLMFVDSDDLINIYLLNNATNVSLNKDLYFFKDALILEKNPSIFDEKPVVLDLNKNLNELFKANNLKLSMRSACNKLLKKEIIELNKIEFDEELKYYEDSLFMTKFYNSCKNYEAFDNILYFYRIYDCSSSRKYSKNYMDNYQIYFNKFIQNNFDCEFLQGLYSDTIKSVLIDKTILDFKKFKFLHMFKIVKYQCVIDSSKNLVISNHFFSKLIDKINKKKFLTATNMIIFHQIKMHLLFLLNKKNKKSNI